jgi:hypothetical protein
VIDVYYLCVVTDVYYLRVVTDVYYLCVVTILAYENVGTCTVQAILTRHGSVRILKV